MIISKWCLVFRCVCPNNPTEVAIVPSYQTNFAAYDSTTDNIFKVDFLVHKMRLNKSNELVKFRHAKRHPTDAEYY